MSLWVVIEQGVEYNDSTYDIAGEAKVGQNAFASKAEAEKEANKRLEELISKFRLCDFDDDYGYFRQPGRYTEIDLYFEHKGIGTKETRYGTYYDSVWDLRWEDFIDYCSYLGRNWRQFAPDLITVQEVKVSVTHE